MRCAILSEHSVGQSSGRCNPGHRGHVWATVQEAGHINWVTWSWRNIHYMMHDVSQKSKYDLETDEMHKYM